MQIETFLLALQPQSAAWRVHVARLGRLAEKHSLPWRRPAVFPRASTAAARVACAAANAPWCGDFVRRVYAADFGEDLDSADPEF